MENKIEAIKNMAKSVLKDKNGITLDEYNELLKTSNSKQEQELYTLLYEYFLGQKQTEVIKNGKF